MRLSWCVGVGRSAGWLALAKDGDPLVYGPCDVTVGSPERLVYEGEISIGKGLERLPRKSTVWWRQRHVVCGRVTGVTPTSMRPSGGSTNSSQVRRMIRCSSLSRPAGEGGVSRRLHREGGSARQTAGGGREGV